MYICPKCGGVSEAPNYTCGVCGWAPEMVDDFPILAPDVLTGTDDFDAGYFEKRAEEIKNNFWYVNRSKLISWLATRFHPMAHSVLEVGCGTGYVTQTLRAYYPEARVVASEIDITGLRIARRILGHSVHFLQLDVRRLPFTQEFDVIGAFDVIEHLENDTEVLAKLRAGLQPGGILILTVPQHMWLWSQKDVIERHKRRYEPGELERKLEEVGFRILYTSAFMCFLLPVQYLNARLRQTPTRYRMDTEIRMPAALNAIFSAITTMERVFLRMGMRFRVGGSRIIVAT